MTASGWRRRLRAYAGLAIVAFTGIVLVPPVPARALEGPYTAVTTRIAVRLTERLSSQEARAGDSFGFETTSSVAVEGHFVSTGAHGRGVVLAARSARGEHPGELRLAVRTLDLPDGRTLAVGLEPGQLVRVLDERGLHVSIPVASTTIALGRARSINVVFERGTPFFVIAPPPMPQPGATSTAG